VRELVDRQAAIPELAFSRFHELGHGETPVPLGRFQRDKLRERLNQEGVAGIEEDANGYP